MIEVEFHPHEDRNIRRRILADYLGREVQIRNAEWRLIEGTAISLTEASLHIAPLDKSPGELISVGVMSIVMLVLTDSDGDDIPPTQRNL